jgi:hypothetical protein
MSEAEEGGTEERHRRRARWTAYGLVAVIAVTAIAQVELWPVTAFRLFSGARTGTGVVYQLYAVGHDGSRTRVPGRVQLLAKLPQAAADDAAREVDAWLDDAGVDPAGVDVVVLERVTWRLDAETLEREETSRTAVLEVAP